MVAISRLPTDELERISAANASLVAIAQELASIIGRVKDDGLQHDLMIQIERILSVSNTLSAAIRSTAYLAAS